MNAAMFWVLASSVMPPQCPRRALPAAALLPNARVREVDRALRKAPVALDWLEREWVGPAMR